jgi:S-adenosyl methyltransferase
VTDQSDSSGDHGPQPIEIEADVAHPARVHNYLAGGDAHFAADREAVEHLSEVLPDGLDNARVAVQTMGKFQHRAVRYLVREAGIRQFLKLGTAIPAAEDIHEVAQAAAPDAKVVYVGSDPVILAHAHALRRGGGDGGTAYIHGSLNDPEELTRRASGTMHSMLVDPEGLARQASALLDLGRPIAVLLPATLNFVPDENDPYGLVARLLRTVASGSYLVLAHTSHDITADGMIEAAERFSKLLGEPYVTRSRGAIARFFDGLDMVEPGLVQVDRWRPDEDAPVLPSGRPVPLYAAVARKP